MTLDELKARCAEIGDCWEWISKRTKEFGRKFPQLRLNGKTYNARRYIYEASGRVIKPSMYVVPGCGNPYCVNPEHMKQLTEKQKSRLAAERHAFSSPTRGRKVALARRQVSAKLDEEKAREIRFSTEPGPVLAAKFGIDKSLVNRIKRGEAWKEYGSPFAGLMV